MDGVCGVGRRHISWAVIALLGTLGCGRSQSVDAGTDAGTADAETADSAIDANLDATVDAAACPTLGPYDACSERCGGALCGPGHFCEFELDFCFDSQPAGDHRSAGCDYNLDAPISQRPCYHGDRVCMTDDYPDGGATGRISGQCVPREACEDAVLFDLQVDCLYYDLSVATEPPPVEACPTSDNARTPLCGPTCGDCPVVLPGELDLFQVPCIGVNAGRGIGQCTFSPTNHCTPGDFALSNTEIYRGATACLVELGDEEPVGGWITYVDSCRQYRALYPDDFDCRDVDWNSVP